MKLIFPAVLLFLLSFGPVSAQEAPEISSLSIHPIHHTEANGLDYYYIEKGNGPTLFFLHGFPDLANTWDESITALSGDYRCIAPFLRGYYPTEIPADGDYGSKTIAGDISALAAELGIEEYIVVGQDWGASVAYSLANLEPERVQKLITVAIPHPSCLKATPNAIYKARHFLKFRNEKKSADFTRKNNFHYLDVLYRRWSPNWEESETTADLIKRTFALPGRTEAALGYYWTFSRTLNDKALSEFYGQTPQMPFLAIAGKGDRALTQRPFRCMEKKFTQDFRLRLHPTAGHFLHREVPEYFLRELRDFLSTSHTP